ncbi:MAG: ferredoxin:thioredoxin reductase [Nitrospiraceae bacterium]|nr:MAG: ferredoxin:thioredoxin reductase [Nitrospiraceae bacterium]
MNIEELLDILKKSQEPQGFFFNNDIVLVNDLLAGLIVNKERYGYMSCPCRLATGEHEKDKDIICPCAYRNDDVREYGNCYCALYVSKEWNEGKIEVGVVPERRPPEKNPF